MCLCVRRDVSALHYDPSKEEHAVFETKRDDTKKERYEIGNVAFHLQRVTLISSLLQEQSWILQFVSLKKSRGNVHTLCGICCHRTL